jgi:hypothetical protein
MTDITAADIRVTNREDALYLLAEAAAIEHNLMCCYLYAGFSLKRSAEDGLDLEQVEVLRRWYAIIMNVAIEEMTHLGLVSNLTCALGGDRISTDLTSRFRLAIIRMTWWSGLRLSAWRR